MMRKIALIQQKIISENGLMLGLKIVRGFESKPVQREGKNGKSYMTFHNGQALKEGVSRQISNKEFYCCYGNQSVKKKETTFYVSNHQPESRETFEKIQGCKILSEDFNDSRFPQLLFKFLP